MKRWIIISTMLMVPAMHTLAADVAAGEKKAAVCFACHGKDGHASMKNYPNLAGQNREYLVIALRGYRDGTRTDPVMVPMAKALTDTDMENIAAYFARFK
ncbi:MAG: cytochrome c [Halothiobacillaceae bacterium]|jgi:cytochrome c553|uniref:c-type cytochrome n=1 Tax=Thiofaba sp. EF100 TaxID=3121274 RepID=UPI003221A7CE